MATDNRAMIRRFIDEVWNQGRTDVIDQMFAAHFVDHVGGLPNPLQGPDELKQFVSTYRAALPDLSFMIDEMFVTGDRVILRWSAMGTHRGEWMGIAPTNRKVSASGVSIFRLSDAKVQEAWSYWDYLGFVTQLGVTLHRPATVAQPATQA